MMDYRIAYSAAAVRALEAALMETEGISSGTLMERAGAAAYALARRDFSEQRRWSVLAGGGNNAGDGFVMARLAKRDGLEVEIRLLSPGRSFKGDAAVQIEAARQAGVPFGAWQPGELEGCGLIVDAMLGIGLDRPLKGRYREAAQELNQGAVPVLAVDVPTGVHADTGAVMGAAVRAALTVTFVAEKCGLFLGDAPDCVGRRVLEPLGRIVPGKLAEIEAGFAEGPMLRVFTEPDLRSMLPARQGAGHKGRFGHVLVIGGGPGMGGAARMAGEGALRAGAGLVSVATHPEHAAALLAGRPELMVRGVREAGELTPLLERATVVAIGCGLGQDAWARGMLAAAAQASLPMVVDADGLDLLATAGAQAGAGAGQRILTPHPGEAGRLLDCSSAAVQADRPGALKSLKQRFGGVALLKGAHTLVSGSGKPPWVIDAGNPGMATAGTGDVLTGVLAGLWAQFPQAEPEDLAALAAFAHARAGDRAAGAGQRGMIASDLLAALRAELNP